MRATRGQVATISAPESDVRTTAVSAQTLAKYEAELQDILRKVRTVRTAMEAMDSAPVRADGSKQWKSGIDMLVNHVNKVIIGFRKANYARS